MRQNARQEGHAPCRRRHALNAKSGDVAKAAFQDGALSAANVAAAQVQNDPLARLS